MNVYIVLRNADMCEGRGPMTLDNVFTDRDESITYAKRQSGVMGRPQIDDPRFHSPYITQDGWQGEHATYRTIGHIIFSCDYEVIECEAL